MSIVWRMAESPRTSSMVNWQLARETLAALSCASEMLSRGSWRLWRLTQIIGKNSPPTARAGEVPWLCGYRQGKNNWRVQRKRSGLAEQNAATHTALRQSTSATCVTKTATHASVCSATDSAVPAGQTVRIHTHGLQRLKEAYIVFCG